MTIVVTASLGNPVPSTRHAVSVQIPTWKDMVGLGSSNPQIINALRNGYPRSFFHQDIQTLFERCQKSFFLTQSTTRILLFPDPASAEACRSYMSSSTIQGSEVLSPDLVSQFGIVFSGGTRSKCDCCRHGLPPLWAIAYPETAQAAGACFWRLTGTGISSRLAEACLPYTDSIARVESSSITTDQLAQYNCAPVFNQIRHRIATLLERATINPDRPTPISSEHVFLFPSGMSAIYHVHHLLLKWRSSKSVIMGFPYELTLKTLETYGPLFKFFSAGTSEDIDSLEQILKNHAAGQPKLQAIWCECPSNPLLKTCDLERIRRLADQYDFVVVVDDTIGSFANVDVLDTADIVVTSLTKSFNGFADVLAGSAVLNPNSRHYVELKELFVASYVNTLYIDDAIQLELNSRSFLQRASTMNDTAEYLVDYLRPLVSNGIISAVYYPKDSPSMSNYARCMRRLTKEFQPGYGCLFTIEFKSVKLAATFFDSLDVHKGPSLGANVTLAQPYVQMVLQRQKDWAASHGLRETIVRISVGLEDKEDLLIRFKHALALAGEA